MPEPSQLPQYFAQQFLQGTQFRTIVDARKQASAFLGQNVSPGSSLAKFVDESIEAGLIRAARDQLESSATPAESYGRLLQLHGQQPNLSVRSSTSVRQQAYSTPIPIAYLAAHLGGVTPQATVYEPSAGHGALLLNADPKNTTVNELNPDRANDLRSQGFNVTENDASLYLPEKLHDVVIANPPFGRTKQNGKTRHFPIPGSRRTTSQIDQAIALHALQAMKPDGRAVLILGSKPGRTEEERSEAYNTLESRSFFFRLYQDYNVTQHLTISGDLYRKQGVGWPVDLIVIQGQGPSTLALPAANLPQIYTSFDDLKELLGDDRVPDIQLQGLPSQPPSMEALDRR